LRRPSPCSRPVLPTPGTMQDSSTGTTTRAPAWWCYSALSHRPRDLHSLQVCGCCGQGLLAVLSSLCGLQQMGVHRHLRSSLR
jgi:hypothetical protein